MASEWIITLLLSVLLLVALFSLTKRKHSDDHFKLPPGPKGLPILGNLHLLGDLPHQDLHRLAQKYGPIMHVLLGRVPTIVVSSPEAAKLFLKTHDHAFASRPIVQAGKYMAYGQKGLAFAQYGPYWRNIRKLCTLELFTNAKIEMFRPMRREEVRGLVEAIRVKGGKGEVICLSEKVEMVVEDMTFRMVFGCGCKDERFQFKPVIDEALWLTGAFNIGDYVPYLASLDLQGLVRRMKSVHKVFDEFVEKIIEEHIQAARDQNGQFKDFIDIMLSLMDSDSTHEMQLDRDNIKVILLDMLAAGMDTSVNVLNWTFPELLRHPKVMNQVQEELKNIVGMDRMVEETDLPKLNYLNMVIKETLRLHPVAPLLLPHESTEDITINGYYIPKKSRVLVNVWTIGRDPNIWSENAEEFSPERFIDSGIEVHGRDFQLIPFGSGRRGCPGMQLGLTVVRLVLAQLLHCFNWELPDGVSASELDMSEKFGLTMSRAKPLFCVPTYRLNVNSF